MSDDVTGDSKAPRFSRKKLLWGAGGILAAGVGLALPERDRLIVERRTIRCPRWTASPFRAAYISDFHFATEADISRVRRAIDLAIAERPEALLMGGDYDTPALDVSDRVRRTFVGLNVGIPVLSVLGNHDYAHGRLDQIRDILIDSGIEVLANQAVDVGPVRIWGIDDAMRGQPEYQTDEKENTVALLHEPDYVDRIETPVSAVLCGHTHGGQICRPDGQPYHLPRGGELYAAGQFEVRGTPLYVTRGIGMTGLTMRAFCPPEVSILTFQGV